MLILVLNPCIRLSWIDKHWDEEYIRDAEKQIMDVVSLYISQCDYLLTWIYDKMDKYRAGAPVDSPTEPAEGERTSSGSDRTDPHAPRMQAWERLALKFNDNDSAANSTTASVEEEFRQYSTSMIPKLGSINSLKFWHVGAYNSNGIIYTNDPLVSHRQMKAYSRRSSQWLWTIFRFKPQRSHVSACSPPAQKQIRRGEIVFTLR